LSIVKYAGDEWSCQQPILRPSVWEYAPSHVEDHF
jgi:hypothetical protein